MRAANESVYTHGDKVIIARKTRMGLKEHVLACGDLTYEYGNIIVLEDDIVTSPYFLQFMNDAFRLYHDEPKVMHVSGFTRLSPQPSPYFTPFMSGWGWGTWRDRWNGHFLHFQTREEALKDVSPEVLEQIEYGGVFPCLKDLDRRPIPWDICWGLAIRKAGGLCLYPSKTLVRNIGLTGGTHYNLPSSIFNFQLLRLIQRYEYDRPVYEGTIPVTKEEPAVNADIEAAMRDALTDWGIRYTWLGKIIRRIYKWVTRKR